jgi:GAF domain-containing protein
MRSSSPGGGDPVGLAELQGLLLSTTTLEEFLTQLARLAVDTAGRRSCAGVTLGQAGRPYTVANSDALAARVDEVQYGRGQGPCLQALASGEVYYVADLSADGRWPQFAARAVALGVRGSLSMPLAEPDGTLVGALNLYSPDRDPYDEAIRERLLRFAAGAAGAVALALRIARQAEMTQDLRDALESRAVIDQALGVIMARQRCDARAAFDILRRASHNRNVALRQVAADIVAAVSGHPPTTPPFTPRPPDR